MLLFSCSWRTATSKQEKKRDVDDLKMNRREVNCKEEELMVRA
jgi:hypothetical protein